MPASLVITAIGPDRPGLVNRLSDVAERFGANWEGSRMASLAGQFAGMAHFSVADGKVAELEAAFRALSGDGLSIMIARAGASGAAGPVRRLRLELVGHDRPGIVKELSGSLARLGVSIDELHTQVASAAMSGDALFKVKALIAVPAGVADGELRKALEDLANEMMVDMDAAETLGA